MTKESLVSTINLALQFAALKDKFSSELTANLDAFHKSLAQGNKGTLALQKTNVYPVNLNITGGQMTMTRDRLMELQGTVSVKKNARLTITLALDEEGETFIGPFDMTMDALKAEYQRRIAATDHIKVTRPK